MHGLVVPHESIQRPPLFSLYNYEKQTLITSLQTALKLTLSSCISPIKTSELSISFNYLHLQIQHLFWMSFIL